MSASADSAVGRPTAPRLRLRFARVRWRRLAFALVLLGLAAVPGQLGGLTRALLTDAFTAVSAFVAAALIAFYGLERALGVDIPSVLRRARGLQVPFAAVLGATPGCGGAVVVVAAFASGNVSFGAVVATLTATMGDAAFLLIATRPDAAMVVLPLSLAVGILSGWIVDRVFRPTPRGRRAEVELAPRIGRTRPEHVLMVVFAALGLAIGISQLLGVDVPAVVGATPVQGVALAGTAICLLLWSTSPVEAMTHAEDSPITRTAEETSFISVWVIVAFLLYELLAAYAGLDIASWFEAVAPALPLIGVVVGFIPGCGPQILVTTMFVHGLLPFPALIGNAISNDGDALFPALALEPRAAVWATAVTAVPALVVAYAFYFLAPGFLS